MGMRVWTGLAHCRSLCSLVLENKITGEKAKDIHENNAHYLKESHKNACEIANRYDWKEIKCVENNRLKTIDEIAEEIYKLVSSII